MKQIITKGTTNKTLLIFIQDSSSTTGEGLAGVTASMLTAYYARVEDDNDVTIAQITLSDLTGTGTVHTDGGIEELTGNMKGWYRFDIPDACLAIGADACGINLQDAGSNNIAPVPIELQLEDYAGIADAVWNEDVTGHNGPDTFGEALNTNLDALISYVGVNGVGLTAQPWNSAWDAEVQSECADALAAHWTTALTEAYAADGAAFTPAQALYMLWSVVSEFAVATTTITCKQLDGSTTAMTFTLDDATNPTSRTRAT